MSVPSKFTGFTTDLPKNWNHAVVKSYEAKKLLADDVTIKIQVCSVCGTDCHFLKGGWGPFARDDLVAGHEIVGSVVELGNNVKDIQIGDLVGVGAQSNSCGECEMCLSDNEQYCNNSILTYGQPDIFSDHYVTQGGYSNYIRVNNRFVFQVPKGLTAEEAAPFFCSGITVYSPLTRYLKKNTKQKVGIIGIGGLGHVAIQFANKHGWEVVAFSRSSKKQAEAYELGAHEFVATGESDDWVSKHAKSFDLILNCATSFTGIDLNLFIDITKANGKIIAVGLPDADETITLNATKFGFSSVHIGTSLIGSKKEIYEMLDFVIKHNIRSWTKVYPVNKENYQLAIEKTASSDAHYKIVLSGFDKFFE